MPLPSLDLFAEAWASGPPDPDRHPEYYEGVGFKRVVAYIIDLFIIAVLMLGLWLILATATWLTLGLFYPILILALSLCPLTYHTLLIGGPRSATLGMRMTGIEVRTWTGERPDTVRAGLQTILFYATVALTSWLILIAALFNRRRRCVHDFLAGTLVINQVPLTIRPLPF